MNPFPLLAIILSFGGGLLFALQPPINARLGQVMGGPLSGAFLSFLTGTILLGVLMLIVRKPVLFTNTAQTTPWMWLGGALGAFLVFTSTYAVPRLGTAGMIALIIAGQILASLVIDHFGILLPQAVPVTPLRLLGAAMLLGGVMLIFLPKFG